MVKAIARIARPHPCRARQPTAHTVDQADQLLLALRRRANDHEQALRVILKAGLHVDAVDPEVDVALGGEVAIEPAGVLVDPSLLQPRNARSG